MISSPALEKARKAEINARQMLNLVIRAASSAEHLPAIEQAAKMWRPLKVKFDRMYQQTLRAERAKWNKK